MSFWDVIWFIIVAFAFIAYLIILFNIVTDLFRDRDYSGWLKAVWIICLIFLPLLTSLVYLIVRGKGMAERHALAVSAALAAQQDYIKSVAGTAAPTDQIARGKELLDAGAISPEEFDAIKAKALA